MECLRACRPVSILELRNTADSGMGGPSDEWWPYGRTGHPWPPPLTKDVGWQAPAYISHKTHVQQKPDKILTFSPSFA